MPSTDSFTSTASAVSSATQTFSVLASLTGIASAISSATQTFSVLSVITSVASAISSAVATLFDPKIGVAYFSVHGGWEVRNTASGVYVSKAPSFGGVQAAVSWPVSRNDARALASALLIVAG